jgi:four helix bundle protein
MEESRYKLDDFELYRHAREFRKRVYRLIRQLPPEEKYCLASQMRRAALSVTNNVAEGHGRWHYQENIRYCRIARGSIDESIDDLNTCLDEGYGDQEFVLALKTEAYDLIRRVNSYIAYLRNNKQGAEE